MDLFATTLSETGHHTLSFRVLDQSAEEVSYLAEATVWITREGISLPPLEVLLTPVRATLRPGEEVHFDFDFVD